MIKTYSSLWFDEWLVTEGLLSYKTNGAPRITEEKCLTLHPQSLTCTNIHSKLMQKEHAQCWIPQVTSNHPGCYMGNEDPLCDRTQSHSVHSLSLFVLNTALILSYCTPP